MNTITDSLTHPLSVQDRYRIDLLWGGSEAEVLQESVALARDILANGLKNDEKVLYINTLVSHKVFESHARKACDNKKDLRFNHISVLDDGLVKKLEMLKKLVEER